jgi:hypothetical protein
MSNAYPAELRNLHLQAFVSDAQLRLPSPFHILKSIINKVDQLVRKLPIDQLVRKLPNILHAGGLSGTKSMLDKMELRNKSFQPSQANSELEGLYIIK